MVLVSIEIIAWQLKSKICIRWILIISFWANFSDLHTVFLFALLLLHFFHFLCCFIISISIKWLMARHCCRGCCCDRLSSRSFIAHGFIRYTNLATAIKMTMLPSYAVHNYKCKFYGKHILRWAKSSPFHAHSVAKLFWMNLLALCNSKKRYWT